MITRISSPEDFAALPERGVEAQKIRALYRAYGAEYDFCRFYRQNDDTFIAALDRSFILCEGKADYGELAGFFTACGFGEIFCSEQAAAELPFQTSYVYLMRYIGWSEHCEDIDRQPRLDEVYEILKTSFDIQYEPWYLDMSHRVRHGVSRCMTLDGSTLTVQHDINGEALLSQIAALPKGRGRGITKRLIRAACSELAPSEVFVLCEKELKEFYRKCGFEACGTKCLLRENIGEGR
ncbi:MAG: GNAT family N-acetyltransferase [Oscillospiraceae bacterium]|nr:GNAT family N-acetyltransferase [Oscillospiraceae bacterium]